MKLNPLTPGSKSYLSPPLRSSPNDGGKVHGYSMLRTQINNDYFQDLMDKAAVFNVEIEGHRMY